MQQLKSPSWQPCVYLTLCSPQPDSVGLAAGGSTAADRDAMYLGVPQLLVILIARQSEAAKLPTCTICLAPIIHSGSARVLFVVPLSCWYCMLFFEKEYRQLNKLRSSSQINTKDRNQSILQQQELKVIEGEHKHVVQGSGKISL